MMYSDVDLSRAITHGHLGVTPLTPANIQPSSIDLTLGWDFVARRKRRGKKIRFSPDGDTYWLPPNSFHVATTIEIVALDHTLAAWVAGKSSIGRLGVQAENAGHVDPGFSGQITLELINQDDYPVLLTRGMKICQLVVFQLVTPAARPYGSERGSHYQNQMGATMSVLDPDD